LAQIYIVGYNNNGKKEFWLAIISNKVLSFIYEKLSPAIYLEQLNKKKLNQ
jgi:hypothetical protein